MKGARKETEEEDKLFTCFCSIFLSYSPASAVHEKKEPLSLSLYIFSSPPFFASSITLSSLCSWIPLCLSLSLSLNHERWCNLDGSEHRPSLSPSLICLRFQSSILLQIWLFHHQPSPTLFSRHSYSLESICRHSFNNQSIYKTYQCKNNHKHKITLIQESVFLYLLKVSLRPMTQKQKIMKIYNLLGKFCDSV